MVVVQDHDGGDAAGGHHEHDAGEISSWKLKFIFFIFRFCLEDPITKTRQFNWRYLWIQFSGTWNSGILLL